MQTCFQTFIKMRFTFSCKENLHSNFCKFAKLEGVSAKYFSIASIYFLTKFLWNLLMACQIWVMRLRRVVNMSLDSENHFIDNIISGTGMRYLQSKS